MDYRYNPYFSTQSEVIYELVKIMRLHAKGKFSHEEFEKLVASYLADYYDFIFDIEGDRVLFKGFPKQKLGKKRIRIIATCLEKKKVINNFNAERAEFFAPNFLQSIA